MAVLGARCRRGAGAMTAVHQTSSPDAAKARVARNWGRRIVIVVPYLWLAAFFLVPFLIVLKISLSQTAIAQPPYTPGFDPSAGLAGLKAFFVALGLDNYTQLTGDPIYLIAYLNSVRIAVVSTLILLLIGFPLAY